VKPNSSNNVSGPVWKYAPRCFRAALDLLGVGLDEAATRGADGIQGAGDRGPGDTGTSVALAGEDAADAPVRQLDQLLGVRAGVLDVGQLGR
jgi:hypothetical protein